MNASDRWSRLDAALWFLALPILCVGGVGGLSGDGLNIALRAAAGDLPLNPNHLLLEPLSSFWVRSGQAIRPDAHPVDILTWLSITASSVALVLYRLFVAPNLSAARWVRNASTAVLACYAAFLALAVSAEAHAIQQPALVALLAAALDVRSRSARADHLRLGLAGGIATLCFVSNIVLYLAVVTACSLAGDLGRVRPKWRDIVIGLGTAGTVILLGLALGWLASGSRSTLVEWATAYAGGTGTTRVHALYGLRLTAAGLLEASARAAVGLASAYADLRPLTDWLRGGAAPPVGRLLLPVASIFGMALLGWSFIRLLNRPAAPASRGSCTSATVLLVVAAVATLIFGVAWNNSDDQFYFQLAPFFAAGATCLATWNRVHPAVWAGLAVGAMANLGAVSRDIIWYPREERRALLSSLVAGGNLLIHPGFDEAGHLILLRPDSLRARSLSLFALAERLPPDSGIASLAAAADSVAASGAAVVLLDIVGENHDRSRWGGLAQLGYDQARIARALQCSQPKGVPNTGPFTIARRASAGAESTCELLTARKDR